MEFLHLVKEFFELLSKLVWGYFTYGWFFVIAHAVVVERIIYDSWYRKIRQETNALLHWNPQTNKDEAGREHGEASQVLDQFVAESEKLGPKGFFVPMTDFSDRLDSIVDGMLAELHDRTNLFILVGIAGTLFGVSEFAFRAFEALSNTALPPGERVTELAKYLSSSMAKAFPWGAPHS
jgi:hypothetical protein